MPDLNSGALKTNEVSNMIYSKDPIFMLKLYEVQHASNTTFLLIDEHQCS